MFVCDYDDSVKRRELVRSLLFDIEAMEKLCGASWPSSTIRLTHSLTTTTERTDETRC